MSASCKLLFYLALPFVCEMEDKDLLLRLAGSSCHLIPQQYYLYNTADGSIPKPFLAFFPSFPFTIRLHFLLFFKTGHHKSSSDVSLISHWSADLLGVWRNESFLQAGCTQHWIQMPCCSRRKKVRAEVIIPFTTTTLYPPCKLSDSILPLIFF